MSGEEEIDERLEVLGKRQLSDPTKKQIVRANG
jgi:hypothetical protein